MLAKDATKEISATPFDKTRLSRFSQIMGLPFDAARMALTDAHPKRDVAVFTAQRTTYSGYHAGGGQTTIAEFLRVDPDQYGLVLIDEIETSLHPRAQRRLIRDLAELCRERELQIIVTTHSPYVLAELPLEARLYLMQGQSGRHVMTGVSPEFAMTRMDEYPHPECEIYVEDQRAQTLLREIIVAHSRGLVERCSMIPFGAANVGRALGLMVSQGRFPRPSCVFLDGDQAESPGCLLLPGGDAPEPIVFSELQKIGWGKVAERTGREYAELADACMQAMALTDHHDWVKSAATKLVLPGEILWQAMTAEWATKCLDKTVAKQLIKSISDLLLARPTAISSPTVRLPLFERSVDAFEDQERPTFSQDHLLSRQRALASLRAAITSTSPLAISIMSLASWAGSRGRFGSLLLAWCEYAGRAIDKPEGQGFASFKVAHYRPPFTADAPVGISAPEAKAHAAKQAITDLGNTAPPPSRRLYWKMGRAAPLSTGRDACFIVPGVGTHVDQDQCEPWTLGP